MLPRDACSEKRSRANRIRHLGRRSDFSIMRTRFGILGTTTGGGNRAGCHRRRISRDISDDIGLPSRPISVARFCRRLRQRRVIWRKLGARGEIAYAHARLGSLDRRVIAGAARKYREYKIRRDATGSLNGAARRISSSRSRHVSDDQSTSRILGRDR